MRLKEWRLRLIWRLKDKEIEFKERERGDWMNYSEILKRAEYDI